MSYRNRAVDPWANVCSEPDAATEPPGPSMTVESYIGPAPRRDGPDPEIVWADHGDDDDAFSDVEDCDVKTTPEGVHTTDVGLAFSEVFAPQVVDLPVEGDAQETDDIACQTSDLSSHQSGAPRPSWFAMVLPELRSDDARTVPIECEIDRESEPAA